MKAGKKTGKGVIIFIVLMMICSTAYMDPYRVAVGNESCFKRLVEDLLGAVRSPSEDWYGEIQQELEFIQMASERDYQLAVAIVDHWERLFLSDEYRLYFHDGEELAEGLGETGITDSDKQAFVVLGYALRNGEMTAELRGRCDAAAAAARAFPHAILVCTGGPTGSNNPKGHTEAGLMKSYLVRKCGIEAERIFIDEEAMNTVENAVNAMKILMAQQAETMTIVTSGYHQRWSQVIYNAMAAMVRLQTGYTVKLVGNYNYRAEERSSYQDEARIAARQLESILKRKW